MQPDAGAVEAWEDAADVGNVRNNRPELNRTRPAELSITHIY